MESSSSLEGQLISIDSVLGVDGPASFDDKVSIKSGPTTYTGSVEDEVAIIS